MWCLWVPDPGNWDLGIPPSLVCSDAQGSLCPRPGGAATAVPITRSASSEDESHRGMHAHVYTHARCQKSPVFTNSTYINVSTESPVLLPLSGCSGLRFSSENTRAPVLWVHMYAHIHRSLKYQHELSGHVCTLDPLPSHWFRSWVFPDASLLLLAC